MNRGPPQAIIMIWPIKGFIAWDMNEEEILNFGSDKAKRTMKQINHDINIVKVRIGVVLGEGVVW